MRAFIVLSFAVTLGWYWQQANAAGPFKALPPCEPGYRWVEETVIKEVPKYCCKRVPNTKKKWVYRSIDDPFCIPSHPHGCHSGCETGDCGASCDGPFCRKQLVKWQIDVPCPGTKCVVEKTMEKVPCIELRKVPCGPVLQTKYQYPINFSRP